MYGKRERERENDREIDIQIDIDIYYLVNELHYRQNLQWKGKNKYLFIPAYM
jgi:hypothetical protein